MQHLHPLPGGIQIQANAGFRLTSEHSRRVPSMLIVRPGRQVERLRRHQSRLPSAKFKTCAGCDSAIAGERRKPVANCAFLPCIVVAGAVCIASEGQRHLVPGLVSATTPATPHEGEDMWCAGRWMAEPPRWLVVWAPRAVTPCQRMNSSLGA